MSKIDRGIGIGVGIDAVAFLSPSGIDVLGNLGEIKPQIRAMKAIKDAHGYDGTSESQRKREGQIANVARGFTHLLWDRHQEQHFTPDSTLTTIHGVEVTGENIFNNSQNASIIQSAAHGGIVLGEAKHPVVESSVLTGGVVLGGSHGSNTTEFDSHALALMLSVVEGIHEGDGSRVTTGLLRLKDEVVTSYDTMLYSRFGDEHDNEYTSYDDLKKMAIVFDNRYIPILRHGETSEVDIKDSIIGANSEVGRQILGGTISESAVLADQAFPHAHVAIENTYLLTRDGEEFIKKGTIGDPILAKDLVAAVAELPDRPLVTVVQ